MEEERKIIELRSLRDFLSLEDGKISPLETQRHSLLKTEAAPVEKRPSILPTITRLVTTKEQASTVCTWAKARTLRESPRYGNA